MDKIVISNDQVKILRCMVDKHNHGFFATVKEKEIVDLEYLTTIKFTEKVEGFGFQSEKYESVFCITNSGKKFLKDIKFS